MICHSINTSGLWKSLLNGAKTINYTEKKRKKEKVRTEGGVRKKTSNSFHKKVNSRQNSNVRNKTQAFRNEHISVPSGSPCREELLKSKTVNHKGKFDKFKYMKVKNCHSSKRHHDEVKKQGSE